MQGRSTNKGHKECEGPDFPIGAEFYEFLRRYLTGDCNYPSESAKNFVRRVFRRWEEVQNKHYQWGYWGNYLDEMIEKTLKDLAADDPQARYRELILQNPEGLALVALTKYREFLSPRGASKRINPDCVLQATNENKVPHPIDPWQWPLDIQADLYFSFYCHDPVAKSILSNPRAVTRLEENLEAAGVDTGVLARIAHAFGMVDYAEGSVLLDIARRRGKASCNAARAA